MAMNTFIAEKGLKPVIDQDFPFEAAAAAYDRLQSGAHFGNLVVSVAG